MTEPDEALLWARERAKERFSSPVYINICAQIDAGDWDDDLTYSAEAYRAGATASAERIKELEAALGHFLGSYCDTAFWDVENEPEVIDARALLKEADQ